MDHSPLYGVKDCTSKKRNRFGDRRVLRRQNIFADLPTPVGSSTASTMPLYCHSSLVGLQRELKTTVASCYSASALET